MAQSHTAPRSTKFLTLPEVADRLGITYTQARRTCERGFYLDAICVGRQRAIPVSELQRFREAAKHAGYLG